MPLTVKTIHFFLAVLFFLFLMFQFKSNQTFPLHYALPVTSPAAFEVPLFYCCYEMLRADGLSVWEQQSRQVIQFTFWAFSWRIYQDCLVISEQAGFQYLSHRWLLPLVTAEGVVTMCPLYAQLQACNFTLYSQRMYFHAFLFDNPSGSDSESVRAETLF